ncbi:PH domain-containing protein [Streptomyces sp. NPDC058653]|uniref:PH domain-containing protein n=1 Tax=Streptomyces sp. NPDC058653 TaxID=3346576 RepID=UPI003662CA23
MTTDSPHAREYSRHSSGTLAAFVLVPAGLVTAGVAFVFLYAWEAPAWTGVLVVVLLAVPVVRLIKTLPKYGTVVDHEHIVVHGAFRNREIAWADIQGFRIEKIPNAEPNLPQQVVHLYLRDGRRLALPRVDEKTLGSTRALHEEVGALREMWLRWRGEDWEPVPEVEARIAGRVTKEIVDLQYGLTPGQLACTVSLGAFPVLGGVFLGLGLSTDVFDDVSENLLALGFGGSFPVVFIAVFLTTYLRRRRWYRP